MENIISVIGYARSQLGHSFALALLLVLLLEGVAALEVLFKKRTQSNTSSSIAPKGMNQFTAKQQIVYVNGIQLKVVPESVVVSTSNEIAQASPSLSFGTFKLIFRLKHRRRKSKPAYSTYAANRTTPRLPAPWIPSPKRRRKLRRRLTSEYL